MTNDSLKPARTEPTVSLLGCGWLGVALAPALMERGFFVRGSTTRPARLSVLSSIDVEPHLLRIDPLEADTEPTGDPTAGDSSIARFFGSDTLVINMPPETAMGADYHPSQVREILSRAGDHVRHILYVSSTSVYGASQGTVDETTTPKPDAGSGEILLKAEELIAEFVARTAATGSRSVSATIVRSAGLIGPGRHPGLFLAGRKNVANGDSPVNMIHQLDLVQILVSLIADHVPAAGRVEIYNAVSTDHLSRREFYTRAAVAVGVVPPTFAVESPSDSTPASQTKLVNSVRVSGLVSLVLKNQDLLASMGARASTEGLWQS